MNKNVETLDLITILSFMAQLDNIDKDNIQNNYIHLVIKSISEEIEKLHKENDIIMKQNEEIIKLLKFKLGKEEVKPDAIN